MWGMRGRTGRKGKALVQCFLSCHIWGAPWEPWERWAASRPLLWFHALMLFTLSAANCFSITQNTRPVLFIMMILWYSSVRGVCYGVAIVLDIFLHLLFVSLNRFFATLTLLYPLSLSLLCLSSQPFLHFSLSQLVSSPIAFPISWLTSHFPS